MLVGYIGKLMASVVYMNSLTSYDCDNIIWQLASGYILAGVMHVHVQNAMNHVACTVDCMCV